MICPKFKAPLRAKRGRYKGWRKGPLLLVRKWRGAWLTAFDETNDPPAAEKET